MQDTFVMSTFARFTFASLSPMHANRCRWIGAIENTSKVVAEVAESCSLERRILVDEEMMPFLQDLFQLGEEHACNGMFQTPG